jgi:predicted RNA-binding protein Jag
MKNATQLTIEPADYLAKLIGADGETMFSLKADGEAYVNPKCNVTEAAQLFWDSVINIGKFHSGRIEPGTKITIETP